MNFLKKYNIEITDKELLLTAFTHSSYSNEHNVESYERLEYLGDAVLQIIISEYLFLNTTLKEGEMSKKRSAYVCEHALYQYALDLDIISYIRVGNGQISNVNETIIADVFESVLAVIYLDQGIEKCKEIVYSVIVPYIKNGTVFLGDYKSLFQELTQTTKKTPEYHLVNEYGPAHDKTFEVEVVIDKMVYGKGIGKTKKEAEQNAAKDAYNKHAS